MRPYLCLFGTIITPPPEAAKCVERALASKEYTFDGVVRKLERRRDGFLYYGSETLGAETWSEALAKSSSRGWSGLAFECRCRGYDVTVGVLGDSAGTTLTIEFDSVIIYEMEKDEGFYHEWLSILLSICASLKCLVCLLRKGGPKEAVSVDCVRGELRGWLRGNSDLVVAIVHSSILSYTQATALGVSAAKVTATTSGYSVISTLQ